MKMIEYETFFLGNAMRNDHLDSDPHLSIVRVRHQSNANRM